MSVASESALLGYLVGGVVSVLVLGLARLGTFGTWLATPLWIAIAFGLMVLAEWAARRDEKQG